jgi:ATP-dependent DNA helicase RecQ
VAEAAVRTAQERLARPGVEIEPRRQWPSGLDDLKGRIKPELTAATGRALGRLTDIGWGTRLRELLAAADAPVPDDVFDAVVAVLRSWEWNERPVGVVSVPSTTHPILIRSLTERLARIGRLAELGELGYRDGSPARRFNSAQRVRAIRGTLAMPRELAGRIAELGGPVLLVDDRVETGWTMALAAAQIRHAGAAAVLPLCLATTT